jgi:hypothetical protein
VVARLSWQRNGLRGGEQRSSLYSILDFDLMSTFLTGLLLAPLLLGAPIPSDSIRQTGPDGLPIPGAPLEVNFGETFSVAQLIGAYCSSTGARVLATPAVKTAAQSIEVSGFGGVLMVAPEDIQTFFEGVLSNNGFRLSLRNTKAVTTFDLHSGNAGHRNQGDLNWRLVPEAELNVWADNSAILISTTLELEGMDVRKLSTNIRPLLQDPMFNSILNMGSSNGMILRGTGSQIAAVGRMLNDMDEKSVQTKAQVPERGISNQTSDLGSSQTGPPTIAERAEGPTPMAERPHLVTTVIQTSGEAYNAMKVLQRLSGTRHSAENAHRIWFVGDDSVSVMWPEPCITMLHSRQSGMPTERGTLIVQATQEDIDWVLKWEERVLSLVE